MDAGAREAAERVVGARGGEVVHPAHEVRRVLAAEGDRGRGRLECLDRLGEGTPARGAVDPAGVEGSASERREAVGELDQVVARPGPADGHAQVTDGGLRVTRQPARLGQERPEAGGHRLGGVHQRVHVVERGPEVHEGGVGAAHERRQAVDRLGQRALLVAQRTEGGVEVAHRAGQVRAALGKGPHELGRVLEEPSEQHLVAAQLAEQPAAGGQRRVEVLGAVVELLTAALDHLARPFEEVLYGHPRHGVEEVEQLVELDRGVGGVLADGAPVLDLRAVAVPELDVDEPVGDARQRALLDHGPGALAQRHELLLDLEGHVGAAVSGDLDVVDGAGGHAADLHLVALHQLARIEEPGGHLVAVATAEEQEGDQHRRSDHRAQGGDPRHAGPLLFLLSLPTHNPRDYCPGPRFGREQRFLNGTEIFQGALA